MRSTQEQLVDIARRKEQLAARAQAQRVTIAANFRGLHRPIAIAEHGLGVARFLRQHPALVVGAVAAIFVLRGRTLVGLAGRALSAWRLWRTVAGFIGPFLAGSR